MTLLKPPSNSAKREALSTMKKKFDVNPMIDYLSYAVAYLLQEENALAQEKVFPADDLRKKTSMELRNGFLNQALKALDGLEKIAIISNDLEQYTIYLLQSRDILGKLQDLNSEQISMFT